MNLGEVLTQAIEVEPGLWSANQTEEVSYPETGHASLAAIEEESYWFAHRARVLETLLREHQPFGHVFDVGGGNGYMVRAMRRAGFDSVLVEPKSDGCAAALERGLAPVAHGTTRSLGIRSRTLPAVSLFDVIEHIESDEEFLTHIFELMAPGGMMFVMVPAYQLLWSASDERAGHFRRYNARSLMKVVETAGFEVRYWSYFFRVLVFPVLLLRALPGRLGITFGKGESTEAHRMPGGILGRMFARSFTHELRTVGAGKRHYYGNSIVLVASKQA